MADKTQKDNSLYYGDNLDVMRKEIKDETVDICYIDPPFNSKRNYNQIYNNIGKEDKAQSQAFIDTWAWDDAAIKGYNEILANEHKLFPVQTIDLMRGLQKVLGTESLFAYLVSMALRFVEIRRVLKPTGSFYLHCDPTASHYLKLILDTVFVSQGGDFLNEIIWSYRRWSAISNRFQRMHDVVFLYAKSENHVFNSIRVKSANEQKGRKESYQLDEEGRLSRWQSLRGVRYKIYKDETGVLAGDVWDISFLHPSARERLGYPTQKPEALLERIIKASCNEGDIVLDAYCGCGTTVAVAQRLKRKWIGIDITYQSISLIQKRLADAYGATVLNNVEVKGDPKDMGSAIALATRKDDRVRKEFEKWAVLKYSNNRAVINEKKGSDGGIDGKAYSYDGKEILFSVKSGGVGVAMVRDFLGTIVREDAAAGIFITLEPPSKDMRREALLAGKYEFISGNYVDKIKIVTIEELLAGVHLEIPTIQEVVKKAPGAKENAEQSPLL